MGNCCPKPVTNLPSSKYSNPVSFRTPHKNNSSHNVSSGHHNIDGSGGGSYKREGRRNNINGNDQKYALPVPGQDGGGAAAALQELPPSGKIVTPNLKRFHFAELRSATRNFRPDTVLGEGGFGRVFKGWVDPKTLAPSKVGVGVPVAVKKSNPDSGQGLKEWQAEVKFLGKFSHPNLVKLLGYCWEDKEFLLVYEYMQKGSLENHLFRIKKFAGAEPLPWSRRIKIAIGAAQGLDFLHTTEKTVIYRDFKSANILLDVDFNAKLSDFGLAKLGPADGDSHVSTGIVGTYGYAAPEYMATGHLYVKSDVYGFGVVLLEMITGQRVLDLNRPNGQHNLVDWARPFLCDKKKVWRIIDTNLAQDYPSKGAIKASELILKCLEADPKNRPSMEDVLKDLEEIRTITKKPKVAPKTTSNNRRHSMGHHQPEQRHHCHRSTLRSKQSGGGSRANLKSPIRSY